MQVEKDWRRVHVHDTEKAVEATAAEVDADVSLVEGSLQENMTTEEVPL